MDRSMQVDVTLMNVIRILWRRKWTFILVAGLMIGAAAAHLYVATRYYESSASVLIKIGVQDIATAAAAGSVPEPDGSADLAKDIVNSQFRIAQSGDVTRAAIKSVGLERLYPQIAATATSPEQAMDDAVDRFVNHDLDLHVAKDSTILKFSLLNPNAAVAQAGLNALLDAFTRQQAQATRAPRLGFIRDQLETLGRKVDAAQLAVLDYKRKSGIGSLDQERQLVLAQRDAIEQSISGTAALLESAKARVAELSGQLAKTPRNIPLADENDATLRQVGDARARLASAEAQYQSAQQTYTGHNVLLQDSREQLHLAREDYRRAVGSSSARVRTGVNAVHQGVQTALDQARADVAANQSALDEWRTLFTSINERAAAFNAVEAEMFKLQRQLDVATQDYTAYLQRAEAARIADDLNNAKITSLAVIQEPTLPLRPGQPKVMLLMILAVAAGCLAAGACCLVQELLDDRVMLVPQAEALLGLPVLASLPYARRPVLKLR